MALSVIGAGYPRTGTQSLAAALTTLGFGPCYGIASAIASPRSVEQWESAYARKPVDWDEIFAGFSATTDLPGFLFYKELAAHFSDAKVVLTVRDPEDAFRSINSYLTPSIMAWVHRQSAHRMLLKGLQLSYGDDVSDRGWLRSLYEPHNDEVRRSIPANRLLVYRVEDGWAPLCDFLGVEIPDRPFPHLNKTEATSSQ